MQNNRKNSQKKTKTNFDEKFFDKKYFRRKVHDEKDSTKRPEFENYIVLT